MCGTQLLSRKSTFAPLAVAKSSETASNAFTARAELSSHAVNSNRRIWLQVIAARIGKVSAYRGRLTRVRQAVSAVAWGLIQTLNPPLPDSRFKRLQCLVASSRQL